MINHYAKNWQLTLVMVTACFVAVSCRPRAQPSASTSDSVPVDLMNAALWQPAGDLLSAVFPGTDDQWLSDQDIWTLPGDRLPRAEVQHRGKPRLNHMQFSVRTIREFGAFNLKFEFRFEDENVDKLAAEWLGNSGIYIFGLYEIQIFRSGFFVSEKRLSADDFPDGRVRVNEGSHKLDIPMNHFLTGSVYGGGRNGDPLAGAPQWQDGTFANCCGEGQRWHEMSIQFIPARFSLGRKVQDATVSIAIDGEQLYFDGHVTYSIPNPTGSQSGKSEQEQGPIVIQDHGSQVSFRRMVISALY